MKGRDLPNQHVFTFDPSPYIHTHRSAYRLLKRWLDLEKQKDDRRHLLDLRGLSHPPNSAKQVSVDRKLANLGHLRYPSTGDHYQT